MTRKQRLVYDTKRSITGISAQQPDKDNLT